MSTPRTGTRARAEVAPEGPAARLAAPVLVAAVTVGYVLPMLVDSLTSRKEFRPITDGPAPEHALVGLATTAGNALVLVVCLAVLVLHRRRWRDLLGPVALLLGAWAVALGTLVVQGSPELNRSMVLLPLVLAAATVLRPDRRAVEAIGVATVAVAGVSLLLGLVLPDAGRYVRAAEVADEKLVGPLGILAGVYPSGNNLGVALALGLPAVLALRRPLLRWSAFAVVVLALAWTTSRTSWVAAAVTVAVWVALRFAGRRRDQLAALVLAALGTASLVLPFVTRDPTAFTNRATYWVAGLEAWRDAPWLGHGADHYTAVARESGALGGYAYQAHNQVVQLLVTGGLVLLVLVGAAVALAAVRAVRVVDRDPWLATFVVALLCAGLFEVPVGVVDRVMFVPFALLPLAVALAYRPAPPAPAVVTGEDR